MNLYKQLVEGGGYNLPFLVHIYDKNNHIYLINDNKDKQYKGQIYASSSFSYSPARESDSSFSIEIVEHSEIIEILENNESLNFEFIGIFNGEEVLTLGNYFHRYGTAEWSGGELQIKLSKDERGGMTFPALIFNSFNNRGNS
ncbi:hypothetical protein [Treponema pectinovorum]|uniref:hypothetical protein n=1 Tax=Treponema pectinovorum TaxID=164 RepID=UPI0011C7561D|nr:hypothetical protein [Treponema pectinovorum]